MPARPTEIARGQRITARWLNQLLAYIDSRMRVRGGNGIAVVAGPDGVTIHAVPGRTRRYEAQITAAPPEGVPILHSSALYSARAAPPYSDEFKVTSVRPIYGVCAKPGEPGPKVFPAKVGDDCTIIVREDPVNEGEKVVELHVWTEYPQWGPCSTGA